MNIVRSNAKTDAHNGWFKKKKIKKNRISILIPPCCSSLPLPFSLSPAPLLPLSLPLSFPLLVCATGSSLSLSPSHRLSLSHCHLVGKQNILWEKKNSIGAECMMKCSIFHDLPYFRSPRRIRQLIEIHVRKFKKNVEIVEAVFIRWKPNLKQRGQAGHTVERK